MQFPMILGEVEQTIACGSLLVLACTFLRSMPAAFLDSLRAVLEAEKGAQSPPPPLTQTSKYSRTKKTAQGWEVTTNTRESG